MAKHRATDVEAAAQRAPVTDRRLRAGMRETDDEACFARMARDYRAAERIIQRRLATNELAAAHRKLADAGATLADVLFDGAILVEDKVTLTVQQYFIALAHRYATNLQLAEFLYGKLTEANAKKKLGALRAAFHELRQFSDEDFARMPGVFTRPP